MGRGWLSLGHEGAQCDHQYVANVVCMVLWTQRVAQAMPGG